MQSATALCKLPPSREIAQCLRFYRVARRDSKSKNFSQQLLTNSNRQSFPAHSHRKKTWRAWEVERNSYKIDSADGFEEIAERKRMSAEFAAMKQEEREQFPQFSHQKPKFNSTRSTEHSSTTLTTHSSRDRIYEPQRTSRRYEHERFPDRIVSKNLKPTKSPERLLTRDGRSGRKNEPSRVIGGTRDRPKLAEGRSRSHNLGEHSTEVKREIRQVSNTTSSKSRSIKHTRSFKRKPVTVKATEDDNPSSSSKIAKRDMYIPIIQESSQVVFINKPPSLLSQPGLPGEGTILSLLRYQRPDLTLQTVNRLDKNTSGVMVLGRKDLVIRDLNLLFKENKVEKNYLALLKPKPGSPLYTPELSSCRVLSLSSESSSTTKGVLSKKTALEVGKLTILQTPEQTSGYILTHHPHLDVTSITHFHVLLRLEAQEKLLVQFRPLTGKKHQLRLHSAFLLGAPVVGDHRYGYPQDDGMLASMRIEDKVYKDGFALHCYRIASAEENSVQFDVTAGFPSGRWGDIWTCIRPETEAPGFAEKVRQISKSANEIFERDEIQRILKDPKSWAKGIKGQLVKQEIL